MNCSKSVPSARRANSPLLRDLLTAPDNPLVLIQAKVTGQHGPLNHGVAVGQDTVFSHDGWPGYEESEYVPIQPSTLVWDLARKVKLQSVDIEESELLGVPEIINAIVGSDAAAAPYGGVSHSGAIRHACRQREPVQGRTHRVLFPAAFQRPTLDHRRRRDRLSVPQRDRRGRQDRWILRGAGIASSVLATGASIAKHANP
ncbi:hypothetical protein ACFV8E_28160 [Streptomyces sp. NPDC059849]|uniref:hypothetical protein n=1 Tax=Streptomyces sp. NPDC059849 TaxID=3346969 RepID=UPI003662E7FA